MKLKCCKKVLVIFISVMLLVTNYLGIPDYSWAAETLVSVESTYGDGLSYYAIYNFNGKTYRSDQIGPAMNRHIWKKLSDEDREKVNKTLYNYGDKVAQFGKEGADDILDWHKSTDQYSQAKVQWQERIMNKHYPELQSFYGKSFDEHFPGLFDGTDEHGTPIRCNDKALNEAYEQKKTEISQAWQDGNLAYGRIKSMKSSQIAYSVNVGSQAIIKLLSDGFFMPHATRGAAVMSDALAQVFDFASNTYDNLSNSDPSPGEVIQAIEKILDQFAGVAEDKKTEVEEGVVELEDLIAQMKEVSSQSYAAYQAELEQQQAAANSRSEVLGELYDGKEDCGVILPALPVPSEPDDDGLSEEEKEAKKAEIQSKLADLQSEYDKLRDEYTSLLAELEAKEEAALAYVERSNWPTGGYTGENGEYHSDTFMSEIYDRGVEVVNLNGREVYFDPLVEITNVEGEFSRHSKEYVDNIVDFYGQTASAYSGMIDKLDSFDKELQNIITYGESFHEALAGIVKKRQDIIDKDNSMYHYYLNQIIEIDSIPDIAEREEKRQEVERSLFKNEYPEFARPDFEKYHQTKNEVVDRIEHYTGIVENVIPKNKTLWNSLYEQYLDALDAVYAEYQEYKVNYDNAVIQMSGTITQLNELYKDPYFTQSKEGDTSYYYDGSVKYAENAHGAIDIEYIKALLNSNYDDYEQTYNQILNELNDLRLQEGSLIRRYTIAKNNAEYYEAKLQFTLNTLGASKGSVKYENLTSMYGSIVGPGDIKDAMLSQEQKSRLAMPVVGSNVADVYDMLLGQTDSYWQLADIKEEIQAESDEWREVSEENYESQIKAAYQRAEEIYTEQKTGAFLVTEAGIGEMYTNIIDVLDASGVDYTAPADGSGDGLSAEKPVGLLEVTNIKKDSATFAAKIYSGSMEQLNEAGFFWTDDIQVIMNLFDLIGTGDLNKLVSTQVNETTGEFSAAVNDLEEEKEYYVIAYADLGGMYYFSDMATFTATSLSDVADLSGLELGGVSLNEDFSPETTFYTASVSNNVTTSTVTAAVYDPGASYKVLSNGVLANNPVILEEGPNEIEIVVTAENGTTTKSYTVIVTRQASGSQDTPGVITNPNNINLAEGGNGFFSVVLGTQPEDTVTVSVYGGDYLTPDPDSLVFDMDNWDLSQRVKVTLAGDGIPQDFDSATVNCFVYSNDPYYNGISVPPVTVNITGDNLSGDAALSSLALNRGNLVPAFEPGTTKYTAAVGKGVNSITVTPVARDVGAAVKVNDNAVAGGNASQPIDLDYGSNTITVEVTAANGIDKMTYTITVTRAGSSAVIIGGGAPGEARLPSGNSGIEMNQDSAVDLSAGVQAASGGSITVGGQARSLASYTGGELGGVDLTILQSVGGKPVRVEKAVRLESGVEGQPITITNTGLAGVSASIPDGTTIMAPSGWDGTLIPPKPVTGTGTAPSGFSVGDTVIEVGSPDAVLLFDRPVMLTLRGVTGPVGYKPVGEDTWVRITREAGGNYDNPEAPPFPGEAYITNGTDTKIITWHFTSFAGLEAHSTSPGGGGGSSRDSSSPDKTNEISKLIKAAAGGEIRLAGIMVHVPGSSLTADARFRIEALNTGEQADIMPAGTRLKHCGSVYEITTTGSGKFENNPITVKLAYDPAKLAEGEQPVVHYYDEEAGEWIALDTGTELDKETQTRYAVSTVNHLTKFALFSTKKEESVVTRVITLTIGNKSATVEGKPYTLDALPYVDVKAGRTLVPVRFVSEALGAGVEWNAGDHRVTITDSGKTIVLTIGSQRVRVEGAEQATDCAPAVLPPGRTFVPLRFISETLGAQVDYDEADAGRITITR